MAKKLLALLLSFALCFSLIPAGLAEDIEIIDEPEDLVIEDGTQAVPPADGLNEVVASGECGDNLTWTLDDAGTLTISGTGDMWDFEEHSPEWYGYRDAVLSIVINEGATSICDYAFELCRNLSSVSLPKGIITIGHAVFSECSALTSLVIPEGVKSIGGGMASWCSNLKSVIIPASVESIGSMAFSFCPELKTAGPIGGDYDIQFGWTDSIPDGAFYETDYLTSVIIPDTVTYIGENAFAFCNLTDIIIPENVTFIGKYAFFYDAGITNITIPERVTSIGEGAFTHSGLEIISIPSSVEYIGEAAFCTHSLLSITVEEGNTRYKSIDNVLFSKDGNTLLCCSGGKTGSYVIPDGVTVLYAYAFSECRDLTSVTIPKGVTSIPNEAFSGCESLQNLTIPDTVSSIGNCAFYGSGLTNLTIPAGVKSIGGASFGCTNLTEIRFLGAAPSFGFECFFNVTGGIKAYYPANDPSWTEELIEDLTQQFCGAVTWFPYTPPEIIASGECGDNLTWTLDEDGLLTISGTGDMYNYDQGLDIYGESTAPWSSFRSDIKKISIETGVRSIGIYAFSGCAFSEVTIPNSVTEIGANAFFYCSSLSYVKIPRSVTKMGDRVFYMCNKLKTAGPIGGGYDIEFGWTESISDYAFFQCTSLVSVSIPESITSIGSSAFYQCCSLTNITIPDSVISIGRGAFSACSSLTNVMIGCGTTSIESLAFSNCENLTDIFVADNNQNYEAIDGVLFTKNGTELICCPGGKSGEYLVPEGVSIIGEWAFYRCLKLESIKIPNSVISIGAGAFDSCSSLTSVNIPNNVTSIGDCTFIACSNLQSITIPGGVTSIGGWAFDSCSCLTEIRFLGAAPEMENDCFLHVTATAYYPANDPSWTEDVMQDYGGTLIWVAYTPGSEILASGVCGDNLTWTLDDAGTLTISGTGDMWDLYNCADVPWYNQCSSIKCVMFDSRVTSIGTNAFYNCGNLESVTIPAGVTSIGEFSFSCTGLTSVTLPVGVTIIGDAAFLECRSLTSVTIPSSVTIIDGRAFLDCISLTRVTIPDSVTMINTLAFSGCSSLTRIIFEGEAPYFGQDCFSSVNAEVFYPADVSNWIEDVMQDYGGTLIWVAYTPGSEILASGVCGDNLTWTLDDAGTLTISGTGDMWDYDYDRLAPWYDNDYQKTIKNLDICDGVTSIGSWAFAWCVNMESVEIPDSVTSIGIYSFYSCSALNSVIFGDGLTSIFGYAFSNCSSLPSINIPSSVTYIGENAFMDCSSLTTVFYDGYAEAVDFYLNNDDWDYDGIMYRWFSDGNDALFNAIWYYGKTLEEGWYLCGENLLWQFNNSTRTLSIKGSGAMWDFPYDYSTYENMQPWKEYVSKLVAVEFPSGILSVGKNAFRNCNKLRGVTIPEGVSDIQKYAFYGCSNLAYVTMPESVINIGWSAFANCTSLTTVELPVGLTSISNSMFDGCSNLTKVLIPVGVTSIGDWAFFGCSSLLSITIPDGVLSIGNGAFSVCNSMNSVIVPSSIISIGYQAFYYCISLTSVTIPSSVKSIGSDAFEDCKKLKQIVFIGEPPAIYSDSFSRVTATAYYPDDGSWWEDDMQDYGGDITWVPYSEIMDLASEAEDYTKGSTEVSQGIVLSSGETIFTVASEGDKAVLVAVKNADGSYTPLTCTTDENGVHRFSANIDADSEIVLAFRGDVNLDGRVRATDGTEIKKHVAGITTITGVVNLLAADTNGDGRIRATDGTQVARSLVGTDTIAW